MMSCMKRFLAAALMTLGLTTVHAQTQSTTKVYDAKYGVRSGSPTRIVETDKNGASKVYDAKYGVRSGSPSVITETIKK